MRIVSSFIFVLLFASAFLSCNRNANENTTGEKRTSGKTTILVDETYARILDDQIEFLNPIIQRLP
jgi:phosphate transport system substrate-binding protein